MPSGGAPMAAPLPGQAPMAGMSFYIYIHICISYVIFRRDNEITHI